MAPNQSLHHPLAQERSSLVDVLDRVLDKGVVIAGDVQINLLDIELLTLKVRLLIASVDKAKEMGIDWWTQDARLSSSAARSAKPEQLDHDGQLMQRLERLENQLQQLLEHQTAAADRKARR